MLLLFFLLDLASYEMIIGKSILSYQILLCNKYSFPLISFYIYIFSVSSFHKFN